MQALKNDRTEYGNANRTCLWAAEACQLRPGLRYEEATAGEVQFYFQNSLANTGELGSMSLSLSNTAAIKFTVTIFDASSSESTNTFDFYISSSKNNRNPMYVFSVVDNQFYLCGKISVAQTGNVGAFITLLHV